MLADIARGECDRPSPVELVGVWFSAALRILPPKRLHNTFRKVRPGNGSLADHVPQLSTISSCNRIVEQRQESKGLAKFTLECPPATQRRLLFFALNCVSNHRALWQHLVRLACDGKKAGKVNSLAQATLHA
jgi:hypothetical protein